MIFRCRDLILAAVFANFLQGCASDSDRIGPAYVSPVLYEQLSCAQLNDELLRVRQHAHRVASVQDAHSASDALTVGLAILVFPPIALLTNGDGPEAAELANLRGQHAALVHVGQKKQCFTADAPIHQSIPSHRRMWPGSSA